MRRLSMLLLAAALAAAALASTAAAAGFAGAWSKNVTAGPAQLKGHWLLQAANGTFWIQHGSSTTHLVDGTVTVAGTTLTFTDKKGPLSCKGASAMARYKKVTTSTGFKLTLVHDTCAGRKLLLTSGPWQTARG